MGDVVVLQDEDVDGGDASPDGHHGLHDPAHHAVGAPTNNLYKLSAIPRKGSAFFFLNLVIRKITTELLIKDFFCKI